MLVWTLVDPSDARNLLVSCVLHDEADIVLFRKLHASLNVTNNVAFHRDVDGIAGSLADQALLIRRRPGATGIPLPIGVYNLAWPGNTVGSSVNH